MTFDPFERREQVRDETIRLFSAPYAKARDNGGGHGKLAWVAVWIEGRIKETRDLTLDELREGLSSLAAYLRIRAGQAGLIQSA